MKKMFGLVCVGWMISACAEDSASQTTPSPSSSGLLDNVQCPVLDPGHCPLTLGCVNHDAALTKLATACNRYTVNRHGEACGYDVIEHIFGLGDTVIAFYHPESGELKGWWYQSDAGEPECAGAVPEDCTEYGGILTSVSNECPEGPGHAEVSLPYIEAGPFEAGPFEVGSGEAGVTGTLPDGGSIACCPMSDEPGCCMHYGGANFSGCYEACDGMPWPNAAWTRGEDKYGCPMWIEPPRTDDICGLAPSDLPDASDSSVSLPPDAAAGDSSSTDQSSSLESTAPSALDASP